MEAFLKKQKPILIGMIHLLPTIGYDGWPGLEEFVKRAVGDLRILEKAGFDAALVENDGDSPCKVMGDASVVAPMMVACSELARIASIPLGVEVLLNDPKASLSIAKLANMDFIRTDYYVDRMSRSGYGEFEIDPEAILVYRKQIEAEDVSIIADVQVKYAKMLEEKSISKSVNQAVSKKAEAVVVTGSITGDKPLLSDLRLAKRAVGGEVKVLVGSGFSINNARSLLKYADGAIVGTSIKTNGKLDIKKCKDLVELVRSV